MVSYLYDVFVSYRRHREWTPWTREHIVTLLDAYLTSDLGRPPKIFIDENIEPGANWPVRLAHAVGHTRVLVPIFSKDYFNSPWCVHELDLMHNRLCRYPSSRLIVPVVGHDGDMIPDEIARIAHVDLKEFRNTDIQRKTPLFERFSAAIKALAPYVAEAIESAPEFDPVWPQECQNRFDAVFRADREGLAAPDTGLQFKPMPVPKVPPRVSL